MRLDKFLAQSAVGIRNTVREYIKAGSVTVNDEIILIPEFEIDENADVIKYNGEIVVYSGKKYYMFNKPAGLITARIDSNTKTIFDYINIDNTNGIFPVGRLDKDTEGLLLLSNDGEFNHKIMYPDNHIEKRYLFWALGTLNESDKELLEQGITIESGEPPTKPAKIEVEKQGDFEELKQELNIENIKRQKNNTIKQQVVVGYLSITQGRKHQVKRMLKAVGCQVIYLKRVSIGGLELDEGLKKGECREINGEEISSIFNKKIDSV